MAIKDGTRRSSRAAAATQPRWVDVATLASGAPLRLAMYEIRGRTDGPTLGISALIHGDEIVGVEVIRRMLETIDAGALRGRILLLPVANPLAFEALTRGMPLAVEVGNLNRVFPGDPQGDLTGRLADRIAQEFLAPCTHLLDIHGGGTHPIVDYGISLHDLEFGLTFGQRIVRRATGYGGTMGSMAATQGKPVYVAELGGGYVADAQFIDLGVSGVQNVLRALGMLDGQATRPKEQIVIEQLASLRPAHGGLLYPELTADALGTEVPEGTLLGRVVSPYTFETLEELRAPFARNLVLLLRPHLTRVNPGDYAYMLGDAETAERVRAG